jgi:hypothetical protein
MLFVLTGIGACLSAPTMAADADQNRVSAPSDATCEVRDRKPAAAQPSAKQRRHSAKPSSTPGSDAKWAM